MALIGQDTAIFGIVVLHLLIKIAYYNPDYALVKHEPELLSRNLGCPNYADITLQSVIYRAFGNYCYILVLFGILCSALIWALSMTISKLVVAPVGKFEFKNPTTDNKEDTLITDEQCHEFKQNQKFNLLKHEDKAKKTEEAIWYIT